MSASSSSTTTAPLGWGVLAPGRISQAFVADLAHLDDCVVAAVGSRSTQRAEEFVAEHAPGATAHGSYEALVADETVDVVYVASPHAFHLEHVRLALEAGKHVLCEKPVALRAADWEEMARLAAERSLFLMEAMWTACHPVVRAVVTRLATGELGAPRQLRAELGFHVPGSTGRMHEPELGGGALLDMGIYPLTLAHLLLGEPEELRATAVLAASGIDLDVAVTGRYPGGALGTMTASITSWSDRSAVVATDRGRLVLDGDFHHPTSATFTPVEDGSTHDRTGAGAEPTVETILGDDPVIGRGYGNEAAEAVRCVRAGLLESPLVPHAQTLSLMRQMDAVRAQVGIRYPDDPDDPES